MLQCLEAIRYCSTHDNAWSDAGEPDAESQCLLIFPVVLATDERYRGNDGCVEDTHEDTDCQQTAVVLGSCCASSNLSSGQGTKSERLWDD